MAIDKLPEPGFLPGQYNPAATGPNMSITASADVVDGLHAAYGQENNGGMA